MASRASWSHLSFFFAPHADLQSFDEQTLATDGSLEIEVDLQAALQDSGPWTTELKIGLSPSTLSLGQSATVIPGLNLFDVKLPQHGIGRFDSDTILTIQTETTTESTIYGGPSNQCVPPVPLRATLAIPVPVVFIHGLIPPDSLTKGKLSRWIAGPFIENFQAPKLFELLVNSTLPTADFDTSDLRIPYATEGPYPTLYLGDWRTVAYHDPDTIAGRLEDIIVDALAQTYATRVNIIGHSAGGIVGKYLVQRGVGQNNVQVSKLIMVGAPNRGTSTTYKLSSDFDREFLSEMTAGVAGFMVPPNGDERGPYLKGDPCTLMSPAPLRRTYDDSIQIPPDVLITNVIGFGIGVKTPYDIVGNPFKDWFKFIDRTLKNGDDCVDLSAFRNGDGFINVLDAFAERGNVMVTLDLNLLKQLLKKPVPPHIYLLNDAGVQRVLLRALGVQK